MEKPLVAKFQHTYGTGRFEDWGVRENGKVVPFGDFETSLDAALSPHNRKATGWAYAENPVRISTGEAVAR